MPRSSSSDGSVGERVTPLASSTGRAPSLRRGSRTSRSPWRIRRRLSVPRPGRRNKRCRSALQQIRDALGVGAFERELGEPVFRHLDLAARALACRCEDRSSGRRSVPHSERRRHTPVLAKTSEATITTSRFSALSTAHSVIVGQSSGPAPASATVPQIGAGRPMKPAPRRQAALPACPTARECEEPIRGSNRIWLRRHRHRDFRLPSNAGPKGLSGRPHLQSRTGSDRLR